MKKILKAIWQLPQMFLGLLVTKLFKTELFTTHKEAKVYFWQFKRGVSLGTFIFIPCDFKNAKQNIVQQYIKHEYGHTVQSRYLGWLYFLIIGIPSGIWASCFDWYRKKNKIDYYDFYTEKSADKLGGVKRCV